MLRSGPNCCTVAPSGCGAPDASGPLDGGTALPGNGLFDDCATAGTALVIFSTVVQPLPSSVVFRSGVTLTALPGVTTVPC